MMYRTAAAVLLLILIITAPALAQQSPTPGEDDGDGGGVTIVDFSGLADAIDDLTAAVQDFFGGETLADTLVRVLFWPFLALAKALLDMVVGVLVHTPTVYPNDAVQDLNQVTLAAAYALSTLVFLAAGLLYMTGPILGISYQRARLILPRLLVAVAFGTVSLPLLQLAVELTDALSVAFHSPDLFLSLSQVINLSVGLVLIWFVYATLLLTLVLLFVIRDVYILFIAATSPLIALAWCLPQTRRYADGFISTFFVALAIGPIDVLVLRFVLEVYQGNGVMPGIANWVFGTAALLLLILIPWQLYGASQALVGPAYMMAGGPMSRFKGYQQKKQVEEYRQARLEQYQERRKRHGGSLLEDRPNRDQVPTGKFDKDVILDHDD